MKIKVLSCFIIIINFKNPTIDRFLTNVFGFVKWYFLVEVSIAQKFSVNFKIIHKGKDKCCCDFQTLVEMKIIWILMKATEIWVPCPRGSLENPGRVSQAQYVLAAYYLLKIKSVGGTYLGKLEALYAVLNFEGAVEQYFLFLILIDRLFLLIDSRNFNIFYMLYIGAL